MAKSKLRRYERVKQLPNVTMPAFGEARPLSAYPWRAARYAGMETVLELGCGKGEHTVVFAAANPRRLYVGIDYRSHRLCLGAEQALAAGLDNVQFLRARIERIGEFFADHSISEIWLTFPDPHPKSSKIRERLSAPPFLDLYARLLLPGATVFLKTDSDLLFDYTRASVTRWGGRVVAALGDLHAAVGSGADARADAILMAARQAVSAYERAARAQGAAIKLMAFKLDGSA